MNDTMQPRAATRDELDALARLWHAGWTDAHLAIVPAELARRRTLEQFRARLAANLDEVRVIGEVGAPLGFCMLREEELYQLFVAAEARGSGVAARLLADGEQRLAARGIETAWLDCAIGNERAARFYARSGWTRTGTVVSQVPTTDGPFALEVWRYEKRVGGDGRPAVAVAHVVLETDRMADTTAFLRRIGMRAVFDGAEVSVYELRGGTHLIALRKESVSAREAGFDLLVDDLRATHARFVAEGLAPSAIEARPAVSHEVFTVSEPSGARITFYSSHVTGKPV